MRSHARQKANRRSGISLLEVCVCLFVVLLLITLIVPAIQCSREAARQTQCRNNLHNFVLALNNYNFNNAMRFPLGCEGRDDLPPEKRWSWQTFIGKYIGNYGQPLVDLDRAWDDPSLRPLQMRVWLNGEPEGENVHDAPLWAYPGIKCPNGTTETYSDGQPLTDYVGAGGVGPDGAALPRTSTRAGPWAYAEQTALDDISDGLSNTLFLVETGRDNGCWLAGGPATVRPFDPKGPRPVGTGGQFGGLHFRGASAIFVDGGVCFLSEDIDPQVLSALFTIAGEDGDGKMPGVER